MKAAAKYTTPSDELRRAEAAKTSRLRTLRLAKEAADKEVADKEAADKAAASLAAKAASKSVRRRVRAPLPAHETEPA